MTLSVHDNVLVGYSVRCEERRIILHTEFRDAAPVERTDVCFEGVEAYFFENDRFGTILFDVAEVDLRGLLQQERARFEEGRRWMWPSGWSGSVQDDIARLTERSVRAWEVSASIGMTGWVLATDMTLVNKGR